MKSNLKYLGLTSANSLSESRENDFDWNQSDGDQLYSVPALYLDHREALSTLRVLLPDARDQKALVTRPPEPERDLTRRSVRPLVEGRCRDQDDLIEGSVGFTHGDPSGALNSEFKRPGLRLIQVQKLILEAEDSRQEPYLVIDRRCRWQRRRY